MYVRRTLIPMLAFSLVIVACGKDDNNVQMDGGTPMMNHIHLTVDSACVQAGNVITPNGDFINDAFRVFVKNVTSMSIQVTNAQEEVVFQTDSPNEGWDGNDPSGTGPYRITVKAISTSGIALAGQCVLHVLDYGPSSCLPFNGTPVCGDQLDPRICGIPYATNEIFCE
ncbi:MAG: gliding motility-associated C-terminal domain-containing protein [Flavobacteriales bacterium]|nr:gliding motility-associated C-terminal domain-containing protein [Flavobacteriales bacterium]